MTNITSHPNDYSDDGIKADFADEVELDVLYNQALLGRASERMLSVTYESSQTRVWIEDGEKEQQYSAFLYPLYYGAKHDMAVLYVHAKEQRAHYYFVASLAGGMWNVPETSRVVRIIEEKNTEDFDQLPLARIAEYLGI